MDLAGQDESEIQTSQKWTFFPLLSQNDAGYLLLGPASIWPSKAEPLGHGTPSGIPGSLVEGSKSQSSAHPGWPSGLRQVDFRPALERKSEPSPGGRRQGSRLPAS